MYRERKRERASGGAESHQLKATGSTVTVYEREKSGVRVWKFWGRRDN